MNPAWMERRRIRVVECAGGGYLHACARRRGSLIIARGMPYAWFSPFGVSMMTKFEIMALIMRKENQFEGDAFALASKLATCLEPLSERLQDEELAELIQIGSGIYQIGVAQCKQSVPLEDLFPASENWPLPNPDRGGFRH
jgi:hypothetical protein